MNKALLTLASLFMVVALAAITSASDHYYDGSIGYKLNVNHYSYGYGYGHYDNYRYGNYYAPYYKPYNKVYYQYGNSRYQAPYQWSGYRPVYSYHSYPYYASYYPSHNKYYGGSYVRHYY